MFRPLWDSQVLVIGCGNVLFGDDGFGPAVIKHLQTDYHLPAEVVTLDVGTAGGELLLDALLGEVTPRTLIIVDAMDVGLEPGTVKGIPLETLPENKQADFSVHQFPAFDILRGLKEQKGVNLYLLGCQVESLPREICLGLSAPVAMAVRKTANLVVEMVRKEVGSEISMVSFCSLSRFDYLN
ncbi:MAG: hydrogenase maturation protease [Anaerolineaceae bacterium]|jgi:coenzyme F420 hydrogenase subunit delta